MVTLVYAFLLHLLDPVYKELIQSRSFSNAIEPERDTNRRWYLFIGSGGLSAVYGRKLILPSNGFIPLLMRSYDSSWLSRARDASRKFGMSHSLSSKICFKISIIF
jgi:hypothetical protein